MRTRAFATIMLCLAIGLVACGKNSTPTTAFVSLPVPPGAENLDYSSTGYQVTFIAPGSASQVREFYESSLGQKGWKVIPGDHRFAMYLPPLPNSPSYQFDLHELGVSPNQQTRVIVTSWVIINMSHVEP